MRVHKYTRNVLFPRIVERFQRGERRGLDLRDRNRPLCVDRCVRGDLVLLMSI